MNRNEAKAYALNELGLDRDTVRQFGNLSRTQTWLDAIAAQAPEGIAAQDASLVGDEIALREAMIVEEMPGSAIASSEVIVEDEIAAQASGGIAPCETMIVETTPAIAIPEPAVQDLNFEAFWDSAPALLQPQPLLNVSALNGDYWDEPEPPAAPASEVIIYPIVIGLLLLWAIVQLLLLAGHGIAKALTTLATALDAAAGQRLQTEPSRLAFLLSLRSTTLALD